MAKRKPRIVITIVTEDSTLEFSSVKGRPLVDGRPSPGPSKEQFDIAAKAVKDLLKAP